MLAQQNLVQKSMLNQHFCDTVLVQQNRACRCPFCQQQLKRSITPKCSALQTTPNSPISGVVIGNGQFSADDDVINENVLTHGPKFKPNSSDGTNARKGCIILEIRGVVDFPWSPLALQDISAGCCGWLVHTLTYTTGRVIDQ